MSNLDLEEQEQLASVKAWWKQYGGLITLALVVLSVAAAMWTGWTWYQRNQSAQASALYYQLQNAARASEVKAVRDVAGTILEQYPRSVYAPLAALVSAKVLHQTGDLKTARAQLHWIEEHARADEIKAVARLRLVSILIDEGAVAEAEKLIPGEPLTGFEGLFAAARGDVFLAQGKNSEARVAYKDALERGSKLDPAMRELVQLKLDALGES